MESSPSNRERPFRVCPACGRLTPAHMPRCVECGEPSVQAMAEEVELESEQRFARVYFMRGTPATFALIGANVAIFVLMALISKTVDPNTPAYNAVLIAFGAKLNDAINQGEFWRFVNPIFIHIGPIHLFVNMYSLYAIGPQVERLYGTARFLILYLLSGVAGVAASYAFAPGSGPSAGASGALFGLLGVLFVFGIRFRGELPGMFRQAFSPRGLIPVLVLNLFITFAVQFIDKWAHLGGLFGGAVLAALIPYFRSNERRAGIVWRGIATLCVVGVIACFAFAFAAYRKNPTSIRIPDTSEFIAVYNDTNVTINVALDGAARSADGQAILPEVGQKARAAAIRARSGVGLDQKSTELLEADAMLLDRISDALADPTRRPSDETVAKFRGESKRIDDEWDAWLDQNGARYQIQKNDKSESPGGTDGN